MFDCVHGFPFWGITDCAVIGRIASKHSKAVTVSGKHSQSYQTQNQTGLTSDPLNQRKVIEDIDSDINRDKHIIDITLKPTQDNCLTHKSAHQDCERVHNSDHNSAQTIHSTNSISIKDINHFNTLDLSSGDQLVTVCNKDSAFNRDTDMNHVTQNDKNNQQSKPNETQPDEEMMDTAMDDNNTNKETKCSIISMLCHFY